eukprot:bmy_17124T0
MQGGGDLLPQVTCHELCHLLGLGNCRWLRCLMQGALSLDEALRRPPDLCPICLRKLQHVLGFKLVDRYKRLYTWTLAAAGTRPGPAAGEPSVSEDTLPCSADSGLCGESDSEPGSGLSEPLSPDAWSHALPAGPELEPEDGLGSLAAAESPGEALAEHGRWLAACIQALERDVTEEELARVDGAAPGPPAGPALRPRRRGAAPGPGRQVLLPQAEAERSQTVQGRGVPAAPEGGGPLARPQTSSRVRRFKGQTALADRADPTRQQAVRMGTCTGYADRPLRQTTGSVSRLVRKRVGPDTRVRPGTRQARSARAPGQGPLSSDSGVLGRPDAAR